MDYPQKHRILREANNLLAKRDALLRAEALLIEARRNYVAAETSYMDTLAPASSDLHPVNVVVGGHIIMPKSDCYDEPAGQRLEFHTFTAVDLGA